MYNYVNNREDTRCISVKYVLSSHYQCHNAIINSLFSNTNI